LPLLWKGGDMRMTDEAMRQCRKMTLRRHDGGWWFKCPPYTVDGEVFTECGPWVTKDDADTSRRGLATAIASGLCEPGWSMDADNVQGCDTTEDEE
jgi:hypothetical protein